MKKCSAISQIIPLGKSSDGKLNARIYFIWNGIELKEDIRLQSQGVKSTDLDSKFYSPCMHKGKGVDANVAIIIESCGIASMMDIAKQR